MKIAPTRLPILYLILGVLLLVSIVPMYFYYDNVVTNSRDLLRRNEMYLQTTVTRSLADSLAQHHTTLQMMLQNFASAVGVASGGNLSGENITLPELRALLEQFVSSYDDVAYATLLNTDARGISAGKIQPDSFVQRELERAFAAAQDSRPYMGQPLALSDGKRTHTVMVVSRPLIQSGRFIGMIGTVVDLKFVSDQLAEVSRDGRQAYVIDRQGRLVAGTLPDFVTGQDMRQFEIARRFVEQGGAAKLSENSEFVHEDRSGRHSMRGTFSPVAPLQWAVIAQKDDRDAFLMVYQMQNLAQVQAILTVLLSIAISFFAARRITTPLRVLTESSRAIAKGDFSIRVSLRSRTEIGELASTFNLMSEDLERFVRDLKRAAEENRALFMNSIKMIAGAVDEKDPYTRGHSDRVTRYSVAIATRLGLSEADIDNIRIAALLHDVGKIGIEDAVLKKPGALTPDEYEIMKTHTTKGATILRPVEQLRDMLPGIELHHESLDGRGYPFGLKGDDIPLMARIISVADTFDAMTTNRPYQAARDTEYVVQVIRKLVGTKFDGRVVEALESLVAAGEIKPRRAVAMPVDVDPTGVAAAAAAAGSANPETDFRSRI